MHPQDPQTRRAIQGRRAYEQLIDRHVGPALDQALAALSAHDPALATRQAHAAGEACRGIAPRWARVLHARGVQAHHQLSAALPSKIVTPGGILSVSADEEYPGYIISVDESGAAVVEWHPEHQSIVVRTYNNHDEEPQHYHRWDGSAVPQ